MLEVKLCKGSEEQSISLQQLKEATKIANWIKNRKGRTTLTDLFEAFPHSHETISRFFKYFPATVIVDGKELPTEGCKGYFNGCNCSKCNTIEFAQKLIRICKGYFNGCTGAYSDSWDLREVND